MLHLAAPGYSEMSSSFFNLDDEQRAFIATNFYQLEETLNDYLLIEGLVPEDTKPGGKTAPEGSKTVQKTIHITRPREILQATIEYLSLKVEARHLQRVLMCWATCRALPSETSSY